MMTAPLTAPAITRNPICTGFIDFALLLPSDEAAGCSVSPMFVCNMKIYQGYDGIPRELAYRLGPDRASHRIVAHGRRYRYRVSPLHPKPGRLRAHHDRIYQLARSECLPARQKTYAHPEVSGVSTGRASHLGATFRSG